MLDELGVVVIEESFAFICEQGDVRTVAGHHNNLLVLEDDAALEVWGNQVHAFIGCNPDVVPAVFPYVQLMGIQQLSVLWGKVDTLHLPFFHVEESYAEIDR